MFCSHVTTKTIRHYSILLPRFSHSCIVADVDCVSVFLNIFFVYLLFPLQLTIRHQMKICPVLAILLENSFVRFAVSPTGNRQSIPRDPLPAVSYK